MKAEKKAKRAIIFSAAGVGLVIATVVILSLGTMTGTSCVLGITLFLGLLSLVMDKSAPF